MRNITHNKHPNEYRTLTNEIIVYKNIPEQYDNKISIKYEGKEKSNSQLTFFLELLFCDLIIHGINDFGIATGM